MVRCMYLKLCCALRISVHILSMLELLVGNLISCH